MRTMAAGLALGVVVVAAVGACSADDTGPDIPSSAPSRSTASAATSTTTDTGTATPGASDASATPEVVDGVALTAQGSALPVGGTATVSFKPRQGQVAVLDITVTRLEKTTLKRSFVGWNIPSGDAKATPYFVRATVVNRGSLDLGGRPVPLYIVNGTNTLIEATSFASRFKACHAGTFPASFPTGATKNVCLVYLSPNAGKLTAVSFRPTQRFDPITWTGDLQAPKAVGKGGAGTSAAGDGAGDGGTSDGAGDGGSGGSSSGTSPSPS